MEKTSWFKGKKKGNETEIFKKGPNRDRNIKPNGKHNTGTVEGGNKVKSVIFVPHTHGSSLAKSMREGEEMTEKKTGYSLKVVERVGDFLEGLLQRSNPWLVRGRLCQGKVPTI